MKRVLILLSEYSIGGTTLSLFGLLSKIDPSVVSIDVLARSQGYYKGRMPNCKELKENFWITYPLTTGSNLQRFLQKIVYGIRFSLSKIHINLFPLIYWLGGITLNSKQYDAVINYSEGKAYLNSFLPARKRITWLHCDYRNHYALNDKNKEAQAYKKYDKVVAVSEFARCTFLELFPQYSNKTVVIYNSIDEKGIRQKAKDNTVLDIRFICDCFTMVSIGRLDPIKQFNLIPSIVRQIIKITDKPFRWYIIGGGYENWINIIKGEIKKNKVEEYVVLLGEKSNVYPYILKSNLLIHPSKSESFSLVVKEAKSLCVPCMVNNYECAAEFIKDGIDGMIVPVDNMGIHIAQIIKSPSLLVPIIKELKKGESCSNNNEIDYFSNMI